MGWEIADASANPISKRVIVALAISLMAIVSLNLYALPLYPTPSCDEIAYGSIASAFLQEGEFGWQVFTQGDYIGRDINLFRAGRIYTAGLVAAFWAFGDSWLVGRAYSLVGGASAALLLYLVGSRFYNRRIGVLAALIFITSISTFLASHLIRPDIWLATLNLLALLAVNATINSPKPHRAFFAGLAAIASFDIHGHGVATILAATTIVLWEIGWHQRSLRRVATFGAGLLAGSAIWLLIHLWPAPQLAWAQLGEVLSYTSLPKGEFALSGLFQNIPSAGRFLVEVYWGNGRGPGILEGPLGIVGIVGALYHRNRADRLLLTWIGVCLATFTVLFSQRFVTYHILWSPLLILLGVSVIESIALRLSRFPQWPLFIRSASPIVGIALVVANLAGMGWLTYRYHGNNFVSMSRALETIIPPGTRVLADPNWWWSLRQDRTFITDEYLYYPLPPFNSPSPNIATAIQYLRPDYILLDSAISCADSGGPGYAELQAYARSSCTLISTLDGVWANDPRQATTLIGQTTSIYRCTQP